MFFKHGNAVFFRAAGVNGGFINDDVALLEHFADGFAGLNERGEVRAFVFVNRRWDSDDVAIAGSQVIKVGGVAQVLSGSELFLGGFLCEVVAGFEFVNAALVDIKADNGALAAELNGEWEPYITKANYGQFDIF